MHVLQEAQRVLADWRREPREKYQKERKRTVRMLEELGRLDALLVAPVAHRLLHLCIRTTPGSVSILQVEVG